MQRFAETLALVATTAVGAGLGLVFYVVEVTRRIGGAAVVLVSVYFALGAMVQWALSTPLVGAVKRQERGEGTLRRVHARHIERISELSLAGATAGEAERRRADAALEALVGRLWRVVGATLLVDVGSDGFGYAGAIVNYGIIGWLFFSGSAVFDPVRDDPALLAMFIVQSAFVLLMLIFQYTRIIQLSASVASMVGYAVRIDEWLPAETQELTSAPAEGSGMLRRGSKLSSVGSDAGILPVFDTLPSYVNDDDSDEDEAPRPIRATKLAWGPPNSRSTVVLRQDESFVVPPTGGGLLVCGRSGAGKTSLLRVLTGAWPQRAGELSIQRNKMFVLPSKPLLAEGSLRSELAYPDPEGAIPAADMRRALGDVKLAHLADRLDESAPWQIVLSSGEQQRLAWARMLCHRPVFCVLDEPASAMGKETEAALWSVLDDTHRWGTITPIVAGHEHPARERPFDVVIKL